MSSTVVLSSDEEEEADNASTGSANQLDSVSPRPADSAHSSPAPCGSGGRVEAAVKNTPEPDEFGVEFFEDVNLKVTIPRRARMKDQVRQYRVDLYREDGHENTVVDHFSQFGNQPPEQCPSKTKKPKQQPSNCVSIILECRSVRVGTLRRMVKKPVIVSEPLPAY